MSIQEFELDQLPWQVRVGVAENLIWYPKVDGIGNVAVSTTPADNTFEVFDRTGQSIQGATNATVVDTTKGYDRLTFAIPSISKLEENLFLVIRFKVDGESQERTFQRMFDVVTEPWGEPLISLNDLRARVPNIAAVLKRQAEYDDTSREKTPEERAADWAHMAHAALYWKIRGRVTTEQGGDARYVRPRLIVNRTSLIDVEAAMALEMIFRAGISANPDAQDAARLATEWGEQAQREFNSLGPLEYDIDESRSQDTIIQKLNIIRTRRFQAL